MFIQRKGFSDELIREESFLWALCFFPIGKGSEKENSRHAIRS